MRIQMPGTMSGASAIVIAYYKIAEHLLCKLVQRGASQEEIDALQLQIVNEIKSAQMEGAPYELENATVKISLDAAAEFFDHWRGRL